MTRIKSELNIIVGKNIKTFRLQNGWMQHSLANLLNISIPGLSKIETGVTDVNLSRLAQIAKILEVDIIHILGDDRMIASNPLFLHNKIQKDLLEKDLEIERLQRRVIELHEEIHKK